VGEQGRILAGCTARALRVRLGYDGDRREWRVRRGGRRQGADGSGMSNVKVALERWARVATCRTRSSCAHRRLGRGRARCTASFRRDPSATSMVEVGAHLAGDPVEIEADALIGQDT
jgi:hypothetical protein